MKVLHINWSGDLGGAENLAYELARHQGIPTCRDTIAYMSKKSVLGKRAEQEGIRVVEFNMRSGFDIFNFKRYLSFIKQERFDIIHDHNGPPLVRLSKIWSPHSIFIQHIHGTKLGPEKWESSRVLWWKRVTAKLVDWYIANSQYTREIAMRKEKISENLISVIYNGIDVDRFVGAGLNPAPTIRKEFGIKPEEWVVGIVGNLVPAKGIDKFIQVAKRVNNAKFVIVGEGALRSELEHLVETLNLNGKVIFTGARDDISDILSIFDVFLFTSNWEAFGITLIEAMASGVPVVAFRVGGVTEVVPEGCGILIPPNISKAVESIIFLRENPEIAKKMIDRAREWVRDRFNINRTAKRVENIYSQNPVDRSLIK
ncbi:glycosyltransferase [candidate division WOR-3 bacterium]|nr:glycosyltransferase [candidate division WOR-3 bacterium]